MAETLTVQIDVDVRPTLKKIETPFSAVVIPRLLHSRTFAAGNGTGQVEIIYAKRHTLVASGTVDIDLDGTLTNIVGTLADFTKIRVLGIANVSDKLATPTTAEVTIGGDWVTTIFGAGALIPIDDGGVLLWTHKAGKAVTATTGDVITFTNLDGSNQAEVDVVIIGIK